MVAISLVAAATLLASFVCSLLEAALYAISPARIEALRRRGSRRAEALARMRDDVEEPIAAILTINTIAHTVGAAWCGALVGELYGSRAVSVFAAIFTLLVLSITEIVPKSLGVRYADRLGPLVVLPLRGMILSVYPIVWAARRAMALLTGGRSASGPTEEELVGLSSLALREGAVRSEEHRWVRNALRLDRVTAADLRTPRTVVESFPADASVAEVAADPRRWVHSRVPLTEGEDVDGVVGLVHRREVLDAALERPEAGLVLRDLAHPIRFVPETTPGHELLSLFLEERTHMVGVVDEYGGFEGVVTLEDVLECLLGAEIVDEHDEAEDMQELALQRAEERLAQEGDASADGDAPDAPASPGEAETSGEAATPGETAR